MAMQGPIDLSRILALGQLAGNALALPSTVGGATQQSDIERMLLQANAHTLGLTPDQINTMAPRPGLQFLNPASHPGTLGKVLSGVGDVGQILSSILGAPTAPPRIPLSELTALASLKGTQEQRTATRAHQATMEDLARERIKATEAGVEDKTRHEKVLEGQGERRTRATEQRVADAAGNNDLKTFDQLFKHFSGRDPLTHEFTEPAEAARLARAAMKEREKQRPQKGGAKASTSATGDIPVPPLSSLPPELQNTVREIAAAVADGRISEDDAHQMIADIYRRVVKPTAAPSIPGMTVTRGSTGGVGGHAVPTGPLDTGP